MILQGAEVTSSSMNMTLNVLEILLDLSISSQEEGPSGGAGWGGQSRRALLQVVGLKWGEASWNPRRSTGSPGSSQWLQR